MRPRSHKSSAPIYVTLHGLHDSNGSVLEMQNSLPAFARRNELRLGKPAPQQKRGRHWTARAEAAGPQFEARQRTKTQDALAIESLPAILKWSPPDMECAGRAVASTALCATTTPPPPTQQARRAPRFSA